MVANQAKDTETLPEDLLFTRREIREYRLAGSPDQKPTSSNWRRWNTGRGEPEKPGQFAYRLNNPNKRKPLKGLLTPEELAKRLE